MWKVCQERIIDISYELFAWQTIHMKCQELFSLKKKEQYCLL